MIMLIVLLIWAVWAVWLIGGICWMIRLDGKFNEYNVICTNALATAERARAIGNTVVWERAMDNARLAVDAMKMEQRDFKKIPVWPRLIGRWNVDYREETKNAVS